MPKPATSSRPPEDLLEEAIDAYAPAIAKLGRAVLVKLRRLVPGMIEVVYDYRKNLLVSLSPTGKGYESPFTLVFYPDHVELAFLHGATMKDPKGLLHGTGKQVRSVTLAAAKDLATPGIKALLKQELGETPAWDKKRERQVVIQADAATKEPRRV